jgi:crotonobetainyl-CoA:carnitine CoA-transferase CaiB-like acyl-CoA transferase
MEMEDGQRCKLPGLPISFDGDRLGLELDPPKAGEHTNEILSDLGLDVDAFKSKGII